MYQEERKSSGIIRKVLLTIIFLILLIFILVWFFPTKNSLKPLYEGIFRDNLNSMREAAETYFTNERLPKNVGDKVRLTLQEMLDMHLLLPFVDKDGKVCDLKASYVEVIKTETEYEMTVNLVCPKEEAYIVEHMGCYDKCDNTCSTNENSKPNPTNTKVTYYEFKRSNNEKVLSHYECEKDGYSLGKDSICYRKEEVTSNKEAIPVKEERTEYKDAIATSNTTYKYLYEKEQMYSDWSNWSSDKEYKLTDNITWGQQELVWNEKNGAIKKTIKTPVYKIIYRDALQQIGSYEQYVCTGYKYYKSLTTKKLYQTSGWVLQPEKVTSSVPLDDTETTKYVRVAATIPDSCVDCTSSSYYVYKVYKQTVKEVTQTSSELGATCEVEKKEVPIYGFKAVAADKVLVRTDEKVEYTYLYHTKTRKIIQTASQKWSSSSNDKALLDAGYKLTKKVIDNEKTDVKYTCPIGYSNYNATTKKCSKQISVVTGYTCPTGYSYNDSKKQCSKVTTNVIKDEKGTKAVYKTSTKEEFKWAKTTSLKGWIATGKKKIVEE